MCGINGFNWPNKELLDKMNDSTKNRGPDGEGQYIDNYVSLGHRRLAIIDLSEKGKQPMSNEDGTIWLVYNGEIYNFNDIKTDLLQKGHIFNSNTDSEVIIHSYEEYGLDCLERFNGMWAFCLYDTKKGLLILSRDRYGIKPVYYYLDEHCFIFSSMISGILCHGVVSSPNNRAIMQYLAFNLEHHEEYTFFNNISSLNPGTTAVYNLKTRKLEKNRWYNLKTVKKPDAMAINKAFKKSVCSMTISDVPIGSCLSGGLDSSAIVTVLNQILTDKFNTYSLVVPGSPIDESKYIKCIGQNTNTAQFFTTINKNIFLEDIHDFIVTHEEPVTGVSPYAQYVVMKLAHGQGAKVLLDGQGADEIFAGYDYYYGYYFYELLIKLKWFRLVQEMAYYLRYSKNIYALGLLAFIIMPKGLKYFAWKRSTQKWINHEFLKKSVIPAEDPRWEAMTLNQGLRLTLSKTAIPHLLRWEDKNSMRWSIESRVPFLDVELVELALSLSSEQDIYHGMTKFTFRTAMESFVPDLIRNRKDKIGFAAPSNELFRDDEIVGFVRKIIDSDSFKERPYWNWEKIHHMFAEHVKGKINIGDTIWKWINTELWLRQFFENSGRRDDNG